MDENKEKKGGKLLGEFKEFISRGNVMDLAIGVIVGGAFKAIVDSLVNDVVMPIIGVITGGIDFSGLAITLGDASIGYGMFIQNIINFLLTAIVIFLLVKAINKFRRSKEAAEPEPEPEPEPSDEVKLLTEIRDSLAKK